VKLKRGSTGYTHEPVKRVSGGYTKKRKQLFCSDLALQPVLYELLAPGRARTANPVIRSHNVGGANSNSASRAFDLKMRIISDLNRAGISLCGVSTKFAADSKARN
jgi:hypothetical protein